MRTTDRESEMHEHLILASIMNKIVWKTTQLDKDRFIFDFKESVLNVGSVRVAQNKGQGF